MELIFETSDGDDRINEFTMEVSNSDSVPQIKQKIEQLKGFPISTQTLRFNGVVLPDDFNLRLSLIVHGSTIHLLLRQHIDAAEAPSSLDQIDDLQQELDAILRDWGLHPSPPSSDQTPIAAAGKKPPPPSTQPEMQTMTDRLQLMKQSERITYAPGEASAAYGDGVGDIRRATVVVRPEEAVSALRGRLNQIEWALPERYEFIYNHAAMDETRSFAFHHVHQGDVIRTAPRSP